MKSAVTISLLPELDGPFVYRDLAAGIASAAELGFDAVELFPPAAHAVDPDAIRELMDRRPLAVAAVGTGAGWVRHRLRLTDPDPSIRSAAREFCHAIIDLAGQLRAPAIIGSMQGSHDDQVSRSQALDLLADQLQHLSRRAADHGQPLIYEPLNRYESNLLNRVSDAATFLDHRGLDNVRLLADLFHMNIEEADIAESLQAVAPRLAHVHFADSNRRAVGLGHLDVAPIADALREMDYRGYLSAEVFPLPDSATAAATTLASFRKWFPGT